MKSFLANGHPVHLYTYGPVENLPEGVAIEDAGSIVPEATSVRLSGGRRGSNALAADYFRLKLQEAGAGVWADCDMVSVFPFELDLDQPLYGLQDETYINTAILYLSKNSPILIEGLSGFGPNVIPPWFTMERKIQLSLRKLVFWSFDETDQRWATLGPDAITWLVPKHGGTKIAKPPSTFYPYSWKRAKAPFEPGTRIWAFTLPTTLAVHLWSDALGEAKAKSPHADSAIGELMIRYGVNVGG